MNQVSNRGVLWRAMDRAGLPNDWRESLLKEGNRNQAGPLNYATDWLWGRMATVRTLEGGAMPIDATNNDLRAIAHDYAARCAEAFYQEGGDGANRLIVQAAGFDWPGRARAECSRWWKRNLSRQLDERTENGARALGHVGGLSVSYVSRQTDARKRAQREASRRAVEAATVVELGDDWAVVPDTEMKLADVVASSGANPVVRRAELMTRVRGLDDIAKALDHVCLFVTTTCASRFHPVTKFGKRNPRWSGLGVRDAQNDLLKKWARTRARWAKRGLPVYGVRTCEPHKCGTVHWHLLLYVPRDSVRRVLGHLLRCFRIDDREVPNRRALANRVHVKRISPWEGFGAAYIAKYIAKNIDGESMNDRTKQRAKTVLSWASAHRIRQFAFVGGPPVGVWREVRRIDDEAAKVAPERIQRAVKACNRREEGRADWAEFVSVNGGIFCKRSDRPIQPLRVFDERPNAYGDADGRARICGLSMVNWQLRTRERLFQVRWSASGGVVGSRSRSRFNNCNHGLSLLNIEGHSVQSGVVSDSGGIGGASFTSGLKSDTPQLLDEFFREQNIQTFEEGEKSRIKRLIQRLWADRRVIGAVKEKMSRDIASASGSG